MTSAAQILDRIKHLDLYLKLEAPPEATEEEIKKAYRKMAKKYYESQLQQRMSDNKLKNLEGKEKRYKDLHDIEHKKEKAI